MTEEKEPTLYERTLKKIKDNFPLYLNIVGTFQSEGGEWRLTDYEKLEYDPTKETYKSCQLCNKFPIRELFYITNTKTNEILIIGNVCIDKITNMKISKIFKDYKRKLERIKKNEKYFNIIGDLLTVYDNTPFDLYITDNEIQQIYKMQDRLEDGKNLTTHQKKHLEEITNPPRTNKFAYQKLINGKRKTIYGLWRFTRKGNWALMEEL